MTRFAGAGRSGTVATLETGASPGMSSYADCGMQLAGEMRLTLAGGASTTESAEVREISKERRVSRRVDGPLGKIRHRALRLPLQRSSKRASRHRAKERRRDQGERR